jgi:hypothetical protein
MTSVETDTVALPINDTVISKEDGFIWIRRKHSEPSINQHFLSKHYYR